MSLRSAFSLVELSFVIAIVSLLTVGGLSTGVSIVDQKRHVDTQVQLEEIVEALRGFYRTNGRLPCPANNALTADNVNFGRESACTPGAGVLSGGVPVRALGLKETFAHDWWFNRYTYVVSRNHTNVATFIPTNPGAIRINNAAAETIFDEALFAIVSHGEDGKGARRHKTATSSSCTGGALDSQNCSAFNVLVDTVVNDGSGAGANFYDDYLAWGGSYVMESAEEMDPQVGTLGNNKFCKSVSGRIECIYDEEDPQVRTISGTNGKVCRSASGVIDCTSDETDPQVGTLTPNQWCRADSSGVINCTHNVVTTGETDPQVGATTSTRLCFGDGSAINCNDSTAGGRTNRPITSYGSYVRIINGNDRATLGNDGNLRLQRPGGAPNGYIDFDTDATGSNGYGRIGYNHASNRFDFSKSIRSVGSITATGNITANGDLYANGSDLYVGRDGGADSRIRLYDDNSNAWRTFYWDDSSNVYRFDNNVLIDGNLNMGSDKIINVNTPTSGNDAANKSYVDNKFGAMNNGQWCRASSGRVVCDQAAPSGGGGGGGGGGCGGCGGSSDGSMRCFNCQPQICSCNNWINQGSHGSSPCGRTCRSCFAADSTVRMADGSEKAIQDILIGESIMGGDGKPTRVIAYDRPMMEKAEWDYQRLIHINGMEPFVTNNHPILTTEGWKAVLAEDSESEAYDLLRGKVTTLEVGDEIVMYGDKTLTIESIKTYEHQEDIRLYNFVLGDDPVYYVNDMAVMSFVPDKAGTMEVHLEHQGEPKE